MNALDLHKLESTLEEESITESGSGTDNFVTEMLHPYFIEWLAFLQYQLLQAVHKFFDLNLLSQVDEILQCNSCRGVWKSFHCLNCCLADIRHLMSLVPVVTQDILDHLLHKNTVISFSSHTGVGAIDGASNCVIEKISSTSTTFPADSPNFF